MKWLLSTLLFCLLQHPGTSIPKDMTLSGRLIYSSGGNRLNSIELRTMKFSTLSPNQTDSIDHLTVVSKEVFIYQDCDGSRDPNCLLRQYDVGSGTSKALRSGYLPRYISETKTLLFYELDKATGQKWLCSAHIESPNIFKRIAKGPTDLVLPNGLKYPLVAQPVQISADEVLFVGDDRALWTYRLSDSMLTSTGIKGKVPLAWRERTQHLISYDSNVRNVQQISLSTGVSKNLPNLKGTHGLVYLPDSDSLIYSKPRISIRGTEASDIFSYRFDNHQETKLRANSHLSSGVWLPSR